MRTEWVVMACLLAGVALCGVASGQTYSALWGKNGETWKPDGRLPDFSFAGYRFGEVPLPQARVTANIVGIKTQSGSITAPEGRWLEAIAPDDLYPADIHAAQLARRLGWKTGR
jgi:hypothetical protein